MKIFFIDLKHVDLENSYLLDYLVLLSIPWCGGINKGYIKHFASVPNRKYLVLAVKNQVIWGFAFISDYREEYHIELICSSGERAGSKMIQELARLGNMLSEAKSISLDSVESAIMFYAKNGFRIVGNPNRDGNIPMIRHITNNDYVYRKDSTDLEMFDSIPEGLKFTDETVEEIVDRLPYEKVNLKIKYRDPKNPKKRSLLIRKSVPKRNLSDFIVNKKISKKKVHMITNNR